MFRSLPTKWCRLFRFPGAFQALPGVLRSRCLPPSLARILVNRFVPEVRDRRGEGDMIKTNRSFKFAWQVLVLLSVFNVGCGRRPQVTVINNAAPAAPGADP